MPCAIHNLALDDGLKFLALATFCLIVLCRRTRKQGIKFDKPKELSSKNWLCSRHKRKWIKMETD
jgi:hypothetical protein